MRGTGRYWTTVAIGGVLAAGAVVLARPVLLGGATAVWGWLLVQQVRVASEWRAVAAGLAVEQTVADRVLRTDDELVVELSVGLETPTDCDLTVESLPPLAASVPVSERSTRLAPGDRDARVSYRAQIPVAGRTRPRGVRVTAEDGTGLFRIRQTLRDEDLRPRVDVRTYGAGDIHVGAGGDEVGRGYGEHDAERSGGGVVPLQARESVAGDALSRVDWKVTARLGEPHVREFETTASRRVLLVVDHRHDTASGPAGRSMLDHGRAVATSVVEAARELSDPLGWVTVGDDGVTTFVPPGTAARRYDRARQAVERLTPTAPSGPAAPPGEDRDEAPPRDGHGHGHRGPRPALGTAATERLRAARELGRDDTPFGRKLGPFFADPTRYAHRVTDSPLYRAVRTATRRGGATAWPVIVTTDNDRTELLETVRAARREDSRVLVFITPAVLFGAAVEPDEAYEHYRSFEEFRRRLNDYDRVTALEVGPRDRIRDVLGRETQTASAEGNG